MRAYNEATTVKFARTIRFDVAPNAAERAALERSVAAAGGLVAWRDDAATGRTYGSIETPEPCAVAAGTTYERAIIALAVTPRPPEAFPALLDALGGDGRPESVLACDRVGDDLLLELDPVVGPIPLILAVLDAELRRFGGTRVTRSLAPLPVAVAAAVAAHGLGAPEIDASRILETYLEAPHGRA
jgi:hypothetical protein